MDKKQALNVIKQVLDAASKGGIFENMDASFLAANSFNVISRAILEDEKSENDRNELID
jgi:hypothetical protein